MLYLRQPVSLDSSYYDPAVYGPVIDPAQQAAYDARIAEINAGGYTTSYKNWLIALATAQYANPARLAALKAAHPTYRSSDTSYFNDFGTSLVNNYGLNVTQVDPRNTSYGIHRVADLTDSTNMFGRDGRGFLMYNGFGEMFFDVSDSVKGRINTVQIEVTYLDSGYGTWNVYCQRCNKTAVGASIQNLNTGKIKTATWTVSRFKYDNRMNGADFSIRTSEDFPLLFIKLTNISKQQETTGALP
jgi:hypothetical protein